MTRNHRVSNISKPGYFLKHGRAERAVMECSAVWIEYGVSIRDLTLMESIAARNDQAKNREPLPDAEIRGLKYEPTSRSLMTNRESRNLAWQANALAQA